jgi:hypothetical protein
MGLFLSSRIFGLVPVLCSERESRSSFRRCDQVRGAMMNCETGFSRTSVSGCACRSVVIRGELAIGAHLRATDFT